MNPGTHIIVVGAGAFGGWTVLCLRRNGARVTLLDACDPRNPRVRSGGETRVIRCTYGADRACVKLEARALQLWKYNETRWKLKLFHETGALWMAGSDDRYERATMPFLREARLSFEGLSAQDAARRFPQFNFDGVHWVILERDAGYLQARRGCGAVLEAFRSEGGHYRQPPHQGSGLTPSLFQSHSGDTMYHGNPNRMETLTLVE